MKYLLVLLLLISSSSALAEYRLLQLEEMSMTAAKLGAATRDPLAPHETGAWTSRVALNWRFNILGPVYWDNQAHMENTHSAVRTVGWHWMFGIRLMPALDIFYEHHSRHILDQESPTGDEYDRKASRNFPVEDSYGLKFNIYTGPKGRSIFK